MRRLLGRAACLLIGHPKPYWIYCPEDNKNYPYCQRCGVDGRNNQ